MVGAAEDDPLLVLMYVPPPEQLAAIRPASRIELPLSSTKLRRVRDIATAISPGWAWPPFNHSHEAPFGARCQSTDY